MAEHDESWQLRELAGSVKCALQTLNHNEYVPIIDIMNYINRLSGKPAIAVEDMRAMYEAQVCSMID